MGLNPTSSALDKGLTKQRQQGGGPAVEDEDAPVKVKVAGSSPPTRRPSLTKSDRKHLIKAARRRGMRKSFTEGLEK